ncbi:hypothetical protein [Streptomyces cacaoi]|uniref:Uncharacterized protein n=1 Tax=Streptomyces cacaoi TaxID=1898 RepID=A0A4Y3R5N6_STRCI|nr:hypothetical protein [Streptomyces cacaoi]NNG85257.1 hypothetical protein [Streptomyces cacaoi]GEB52147.1 hypothetical protein SCA03_46980 [Streptomyces cacaoi]
MGQDSTLARGARVFGAALITALALVSLGWIIRDFATAEAVTDVWWNWTGRLARSEDGVWTTSYMEPTLLLLYAVAATTVVRSSSAAGILTGTGLLTVVLRAPGLWNLNADWIQGVPDGLLSKALFTTIGTVVAGVVLVVTAVAGRRTGVLETPPPPGWGPAARTEPEEPPAGPTRGGAVAAFLLLGAGAVVMAAWEIRDAQQAGWERYRNLLTGERSIVGLLDVPSGWATWTAVVLALVVAVGALSSAAFSRPLGLITAAPVAAFGVFSTAYAVKMKLWENFGSLGMEGQLRLLTGLFEIVVGLGVLLALARGERQAPRALPRLHSGGVPQGAPPAR